MFYKSIKGSYSGSIIFALLMLIGSWGCKSTDRVQQKPSERDQSELEELYWNRVDSSRMSFTEADVKFTTGMIAHHAQALVMSRLAPENGASEQVQTLAARIINAQKDEISTMQQWLRDRDQPTLDIDIEGLKLAIEIEDEPYTSFRNMPGVLSQEKIKELSNASGSEFDRLFLKYMIQHHKGAVVMVDNLFETDGAAQDQEIFKLASSIQVDQRTEIERMNHMLEKLSGSN